jgi:PKD domain/RTX calcium-binding nonapeptide repeat (4 copies)
VSRSIRTGAVALLALATLLVALLFAEAAGATIYCVADPSCPPGSVAEATPEEAIEAADLNAAPDTVMIGPGEFTSGPLSASTTVDIVGAGTDQTQIVANPAVINNFLLLQTSGSSVSNLELRLTEKNTTALWLDGGADVSDLAIRAGSSLAKTLGIFIGQAGTEATRLDIRLGPALTSQAILPRDGGSFTDSFLQAGIGIGGGESPTVARRLHIRAAIGLEPFGGILTIRDSLVEPNPETAFFYGTDVDSSNGAPESPGSLLAANLTIIGNGEPGSAGVLARGNTGNASVSMLNSVVADVETSLWRVEKGGDDVDLAVRYSSYDGSKTTLAGAGTGSDTLENNLAGAPDSGFVDPAASDYRLRSDSVLLDAGDPVPPIGESDLRGLSRVRDGDGNGSSVTDIGAFEYQRVPPGPAFSVAPAAPLFGELVAFDGSATSDVDGDPLSLSWSLGDGGAAAGALASHLYALPGTYQAALTATDVTGLSASVTHPVGVALRTGRCANRRKGTARADRLSGFEAGDRLDGLGGNDVLRGNAGDDCLFGRRGRDHLKGGAGRDLLDGGGGNDVLDVRGGGRDHANCGAGRHDVVRAGKGDKLRNCERIRRGKRRSQKT